MDTLISVVHTFLTSPNLFTQPFLKGGRERVRRQRQATEKRKKIGFEVEETKGNGIWELKDGKKERGFGDLG